MSIEVRKQSDDTGLASFNMGESSFDLSFVPKKTIVVQESKPIEKKKEEKMEKKKPEPKFFYEYLLESWQKKIENPNYERMRKQDDWDEEEWDTKLFCPACAVCELLGIEWKDQEGGMSGDCCNSHKVLANRLEAKGVKFRKDKMTYCSICARDGRGGGYDRVVPTGHGSGLPDEIRYAAHLCWHRIHNNEIAKRLKKDLYDQKGNPRMLPEYKKELEAPTWRVLGNENVFEIRDFDIESVPLGGTIRYTSRDLPLIESNETLMYKEIGGRICLVKHNSETGVDEIVGTA